MKYNKKEDIIENLRDAGCTEEDIACFLYEFCNDNKRTGIKKLQEYRCSLLDDFHIIQKKIDCLDYFLYKLKKDEVHIDL